MCGKFCRWIVCSFAVALLFILTRHFASAIQPPPPATVTAENADRLEFSKLDSNEDGYLSGKEMVTVSAYDANGDKRVTEAEFLTARQKLRNVNPLVQDTNQFESLDKNEDGRLSGKEVAAWKQFDSNGDGEVSKAEFLSGRAAERKTAQAPADAQQYKIFTTMLRAVEARDTKLFMSLLHPELPKVIDEPILQFYFDVLHDRLGSITRKKPSDLKRETKTDSGVSSVVTSATVAFEKGTGVFECAEQEGKIVSFDLASSLMTDLHKKLGARFVNDNDFAAKIGKHLAPRGEAMLNSVFAAEDEKAYAMLHPQVREQISLEDAKAEFLKSRVTFGPIHGIDYDGFTEVMSEAGELKRLLLNYKIAKDEVTVVGQVEFHIVGFYSAITGMNVKEDDAPAMSSDELKTYRHDITTLESSHAPKFVPFTFKYPPGFTFDPAAGKDSSPNSVKVARDIELGDGLLYTQENFAIGSCQVDGTGEVLELGLELLTTNLRKQIEAGFDEFQLNRQGKFLFSKYEGYGFDFSCKLPHPLKEKVDCWGRMVLLAPSVIQQEHGLVIIMLATSEAPELKGLADLGVKGQLPIIIDSFHVGTDEPAPVPPPAIKTDAEEAAAHYDRALQHTDKQEWKEAFQELSIVLTLQPNHVDGLIGRGNIRYLAEDYRGALTDYGVALNLDPKNATARNNHGVMHYYLDELDQALADYEMVLKLDPQNGLAYSNRGLVRLLRNESAAAQVDFDKAIEILGPDFEAEQKVKIDEAHIRRRAKLTPPPKP